MPDEDKNFGGSLVLDFRKWWRHVQAKDSKLSNCPLSHSLLLVDASHKL